MRGVVAAGHPITARAGADVLRAGGNAVDAAVACVLMSWVAESPLTGPGAGGFMLVHTSGGEDHLLDFFVAAPGRGLGEARAGRAHADRHPLLRGRRAALQRRPVLLRRLRQPARPDPGARALRQRGAEPADRRTRARRRARGSTWCRCRRSSSRSSRRSSARAPSAPSSTPQAASCCARATPSASASSATCSTGSAPRDPTSSTRATWREPAATGCWSAAGCSRSRTWPRTRWSSASRPR